MRDLSEVFNRRKDLMRYKKWLMILFVFYAEFSLAGMMGGGMMRHTMVSSADLPSTYKGVDSPIVASNATVQKGATLYHARCSMCHGNTGEGDGVAARQLSPPPANLKKLIHGANAVKNDFLFWIVSEGGQIKNSAMPAFKQSLSEKDRWSIIQFLHTL